jgi:hypothetical protein
MIAALQKDGLSALALQQGSGQVQPPPGVETAEVAQALKFLPKRPPPEHMFMRCCFFGSTF